MKRIALNSAAAVATLLAALPALAGTIFEVRTPVGANPFVNWVYVCEACNQTDFDSITLPGGFTRNVPSVEMYDSKTFDPLVPPAGTAPSLDLVPGIPGDDFQLVAQSLSVSILAADPTVLFFATSEVERDSVFTYGAGRTIHEITDPTGARYVLFALDPTIVAAAGGDLDAVDLSALPQLAGWTYSSRVLTEELTLDSGGEADLFLHGSVATWQLVPEPGTLVLLGAGLLCLGGRGRARR